MKLNVILGILHPHASIESILQNNVKLSLIFYLEEHLRDMISENFPVNTRLFYDEINTRKSI